MFCPECGESNRDELRFCTKCGSPLTENQPEASNKQAFSLDRVRGIMDKVQKRTVFCVVGIIILLASVYIAGSVISNPKAVVKRYFESLISSDWSAMYDCMAFNESELVNKPAFAAYLESTQTGALFDVESYEIVERLDTSLSDSLWGDIRDQRSDESQLVKTYTINYIEAGTSAKKSMTVELILQAGKKLLFFDNYKVSAEGMIAANCLISVPKDALVYIDGIQLLNIVPQQKSTDRLDIYTTPYMFSGRHDLTVRTSVTEDYEEELYIQSGDSFTVSELKIKQSVMDELASRTEEDLRQLYSSAVETGQVRLSSPVSNDANDAERLKYVFDSVASGVKNSDGTGLKNVYFKDFIIRNDSRWISSELIYQSTLDYQYDTVVIKMDSWNNALIEEPSGETRTGTVSITYAYENGAWVIKSIDDYAIYF